MSVTTAEKRVISLPATREASEWRFVSGVIVLVLVLSSIPYLFAYLYTPPDKQFMGIMLDVPDHVQYFSWMRELSHAFLATDKLTPEPNRPIFFNLLWWGLGHLGLLLGANYAAMYQLLRLTATILLLLLVYRVITWFLDDRTMRRTAFLLVAFTSGFGWVLIALKYTLTHGQLLLPLDVYIAEGNTFLDILAYPHFIAAALYILIFDLVLRGQAKGQLRYAFVAGLVALFLGWQHAYDLTLVYGILGGYTFLTIIRDRKLPRYLIVSLILIGLISVWPALYSVWLTLADPVWKKVLAQFANAGVYTPSLWQLPILLGPAFLLAIYTAIRKNPFRLGAWDDKNLFILAWFVSSFFLIYIPTDFQIHMLNGWQVPIAILATQGLFRYMIPAIQKQLTQRNLSWSPTTLQHGLAAALILVVLPTNLYLFGWRFTELSKHDYPYYLYKDEISAMNWLEANASPQDVVLSSLTIGQYIPMLTGTNAFLAHWAQTLNFYDKEAMVQEFFSASTSDAHRAQILGQYRVSYIFYGPEERSLGSYAIDQSPLVKPVYVTPQARVYAVLTDQINQYSEK